MTDQTPAANPAQGTAAPQVSMDNAPDEGTATAQAEPEHDGAEPKAGESQQKPSADDDKKRQSRYDRKIGKLTGENHYLKRQIAELTSRVDNVDKRTAPQAAPKPARASFETEDDFIEALTDWKLETKLAERDKANPPNKDQSNDQSRDIGVSRDDWGKRETAFAEKTPDYDDVLEDLVIPRNIIGGAVTHAILKHEKGPEILYHLAKNHEEADVLFALPPERAIPKINRIADGLGKSVAAAPKQTLPNPPSSIRGSGSGPKELSGRELRRKAGLIK